MKYRENQQKTKNKMADLSLKILIIALHANALNISIKRQIDQVEKTT